MNALTDLLARPESRTLDFKRQEVKLPKALKTLVAFANTAGGILVLGVADDKTVLGVEDVRAEEERYANAISTSIEPPLDVELEIAEYDGTDLLLVRVLRSGCPDRSTSGRMGRIRGSTSALGPRTGGPRRSSATSSAGWPGHRRSTSVPASGRRWTTSIWRLSMVLFAL